MTSLEAAEAELLTQVGRTRTVEIGPLDRLSSRRFATTVAAGGPPATGEPDQVDGSSAGVHPLYLSSVREWGTGPPADDLLEDGTTSGDVGLARDHPLRVVGGGQSLVFVADVDPGEAVVVDNRVTEVRRKSGGSGDLLIVTVERTFRGTGGRVLVRCTESRVMR